MVHPRSSAPQVFGPSPVEVLSRRSKSAGPGLPGRRKGQRRKATALETERPWLDPCEVKAPRGGQRWFPDRVPTYGAAVRKEARGLLNRRPQGNDFSGWQMNFPAELPSGAHCPICTLGECGDVNCPTYRPKHPEVREAIEEFVVAKCLESLSTPAWTLNTYVSVGSGLLAQDWIMLEKLQSAAAELRPCRAVFVDLRAAGTALGCEGRVFRGDRGLDMRQMGFAATLGPEFSFSAIITFEGPACWGSRIFDFGNGSQEDNLFVEVASGRPDSPEAPGTLIFGVLRENVPHAMPVHSCWMPGQTHVYLFTVSATGVMRVYVDNQLAGSSQGHPPRCLERRHLYVGQSTEDPDRFFRGSMRKIKVWDHCVDTASVDGLFSAEMDRALKQFATWYAEDLTVWTFGSLAAYTLAVTQDPRFAADLLLRIDVHDEIDGYDDFVRKVLSPSGLALTLGGPGRSWRRNGLRVEPVDVRCEIMDQAYRSAKTPWAFVGRTRAWDAQANGCWEAKFRRLSGPWGSRRKRTQPWCELGLEKTEWVVL